ncbi:MAG: HAD-IB family hydrolase, partial [Patescibacteria group bacterium]
MKKRPIAIFDIDGTIFRSSLLIELNALLVKHGIFPQAAHEEVAQVREAWLDRKGSYVDYINTIVGLYGRDIRNAHVSDVRRISRLMINEQKHRVYVFTRELIKKLRKTHTLIVISYSPSEVVEAFNHFYHFDIVSGLSYPNARGRYTGTVHVGEAPDKKATLTGLIAKHNLSLKNSIGIGDSESDIAFLELVRHPIAFNPNKKLYAH